MPQGANIWGIVRNSGVVEYKVEMDFWGHRMSSKELGSNETTLILLYIYTNKFKQMYDIGN